MNETTQVHMNLHTSRFSIKRFFGKFGHDASQDWLFLLIVSACIALVSLFFAIWMYGQVYASKAFSTEAFSAEKPSIVVDTQMLTKTIELFDQKKVNFTYLRRNGIDAPDPSL